jgi:5-methylcytosine-specific restriction endonuclease McrA
LEVFVAPPKIPLIFSHPEIAGRLVNLSLGEVLTQGSDKKVEWYCESEPHTYEASVANTVLGRKCSYCKRGPHISYLASTNPKLAKIILSQIQSGVLVHRKDKILKYCTRCFELKNISEFYISKGSRDGRKAYCKECGLTDSKKYLAENFQKVSDYQRKQYEKMRVKRLEQVKAWSEENSEKTRVYKKKYSKAHPEVGLATRHRRRARLRDADFEHYKYLEIFERDNWTCQICKKPIDKSLKSPHPLSPNLDHIKPLAKGGSDTPSNVQATHRKCNLKKSATWS